MTSSPSRTLASNTNVMMMCPEEQLATRQLSNMSNEAYHSGESASVAFVWESEPGTPKFKSSHNRSLPPLSPPPSYYYASSSSSPNKGNVNKPKKSPSKPNLFQAIFVKRNSTRKEPRLSPSPLPSSSSSISSSSSSTFSSPSCSWVPSSPVTYSQQDEEQQQQDQDLYDVAVCNAARSGGCYASMIKKVLLRDCL